MNVVLLLEVQHTSFSVFSVFSVSAVAVLLTTDIRTSSEFPTFR